MRKLDLLGRIMVLPTMIGGFIRLNVEELLPKKKMKTLMKGILMCIFIFPRAFSESELEEAKVHLRR